MQKKQRTAQVGQKSGPGRKKTVCIPGLRLYEKGGPAGKRGIRRRCAERAARPEYGFPGSERNV